MNKLNLSLWGKTLLGLLLMGCTVSGTGSIESLSDLKGLKVGVPRGTTHETYIAEQTDAIIKSYPGTMEAIAALHQDRVSAAVTNKAVATVMTRKDSSLQIVPLDMGKDPVAVAVRKGCVSLTDSINDILSSLKSEGVLMEMENRWLETDGVYQPVYVGIPRDGAPLRIAVSASREPFCFKDETGNICGFDAELAYRIANRLNRPLQFQDMKFSALITALQTGKADVIISLMNDTPERAKVVDFSIPYYESYRALLQKK